MIDTALLTEKDAACLLHISIHALRHWRREGRGPQYLRLGRRMIRYRLPDLQAYVAVHVEDPTEENF